MIDKEQALKNIDKWFEDLRIFWEKIKNNFSRIRLIEESKEKHYLITFLNYFYINAQLSSDKQISLFLHFFDLVDWNTKDKFTYFYHHYWMNYLPFFELQGDKEICEKYNIVEFFEKNIYLEIDSNILDKLFISQNTWIDYKFFIKHFYKDYIDNLFESVYYTYYENDLIDCEYKNDKKIIVNTLSYLYSVLWDKFEINEKMFNKKQKIYFDKFLISYYYVWFIEIIWFPNKANNQSIKIKILPKLKNILDEIEEKRELIMDKVFDEKYKEIKLKKKNWTPHLLEWKLEFIWDENKFVEIRKKYPNSKITWNNYKWKTTKYEVIENIKLDKLDNKI